MAYMTRRHVQLMIKNDGCYPLSDERNVKREKIEHTAVWSGAIHYNTDNIHIHIATVEPYPTRERGKRKQTTLDAMKAKVAQNIMDRGQEQNKLMI